jgi:ABC-type multidrug transport system, ATPase and permease components
MNNRNNKTPQDSAKAKDFKGSIKRLLTYLSNYKLKIALALIFSVGSACFAIIGPKMLGNATTEIFNGLIGKVTGESSGIDFSKITGILLTLFILYLISMVFSYIQQVLMTGVNQNVTYNLRKAISEKIHRMPLKYFESNTTGEILSKVTNDVDTISQSLEQSLSQAVSSFTMLIGVIVMMLTISPLMTLVAILIVPLAAVLMGTMIGKSQKHFQIQQEYLGILNGSIEETYTGHDIVNLYNNKEEASKEFDKTNEILYDSAWKSQFLSGMMQPIMQFIGNLGYVVVSILGGYLALKGTIAIGDILSFTQYVRTFMQPIAQAAQITTMLQSLAAAAERVFEFIDEKEEVKETNKNIDLNKIKGTITFENVKFGYNKDKIIINNFSANIKKGQKIAIVGPTGAGKTTIVKLLMRFYDVDSGEIKIDNYNIKDFKRNDLRNMFGMVLQDTWLYNDTIKENIKYGKLNATDEEIEKAAIASHVDHFIRTLPDGYEMELNEESDNISAGQKQLLTIARVFLRDPKVLILDEATSSVDTRTEILIQKAMDSLMKNRTSFIIAHRLSTIRNADLILVMDNGDIVEQGSHEELISKKGFYEKLYNSQFEEEDK